MILSDFIGVRDYCAGDIIKLRRAHEARGFDFNMPDFSRMEIMKVCADPNGIIGAAGIRLTAEAYLFLDPAAKHKALGVLALHEAVRKDALELGLSDVHAWLAPQVEKKFGWQLMRLGWKKHDWVSYSREVK